MKCLTRVLFSRFYLTGTYRCHALHRGSGKWYELQDLHVTEILPQMITLSESYVQIWQRISPPFKDISKGQQTVTKSGFIKKKSSGDNQDVHLNEEKRNEQSSTEFQSKESICVEMKDIPQVDPTINPDLSRGIKRKLQDK